MEQLVRNTDPTGARPRHRSTSRIRRRTERAASLVEYALLVALIAVACVLAVQELGQAGSDNLQNSGSRVSVAGS